MLLAFTLSSTPPPATRRTCVVTWRASCLDAAFLHIRTCSTVQSQACLGVPLLAFTLFVVVSPDTPTHTRRHLTHGLLSTQPFPTFEPAPLCRFRPPAAYRCWPLLFRRRLHRRPDAHAPSADARAALDAAFLPIRTCSTVQIQVTCGLPLLAFTLSSTPPPATRRTRPVY